MFSIFMLFTRISWRRLLSVIGSRLARVLVGTKREGDFTSFARRGQHAVVFILGHVLSEDRPQSVPGPRCDSQLDLDAMAGPVWVLERVSQRGMARGVTKTVLPADQVAPAVLFRDILSPGSFSIIVALLWPPLWSVIMLPLLLLVLNLG